MPDHEAIVARLRIAILHYLQENPHSADTLDGIADWWLPSSLCRADRAMVERALEQLVDEGKVERVSLVDGTTIYRRGHGER